MIRICLKFMHFDPSAGEVSYWPFPDLVSVAWWAHRVLTGGTVKEIRDLAKHVHDRIAEYFAWARHDALSSAVAHLAENCTACGARRGYRHEGLEFGQAHDLWPNGDSGQHGGHDDGYSRSLVRRRQQRRDHRCDGDDEDQMLAKHRSRARRVVAKSPGSPPATPAFDDSPHCGRYRVRHFDVSALRLLLITGQAW